MGHQPYVSSIPPLFRRGETPLYIPSLAPVPPDVDRFPSSQIHLPRRPSDPLDPASRYRLNTRSHSARITRWDLSLSSSSSSSSSCCLARFLFQILQRLQAYREEETICREQREI